MSTLGDLNPNTEFAGKNNLSAIIAPAVGNDGTQGYEIGSQWVDTVGKKEYVCVDTSTGAAVWTETTGSGINFDGNAFYNGATLDTTDFAITSNGTVVTASFEKDGGGDINLIFDADITVFDATPIATIALTVGTDIAPTLNYIFIPKSTGVLTVSTVGFPTTEQYVPLAKALIQSAASVQADGCMMVFGWTDHLADSGIDEGHMQHVNKWIRKQNATWLSGILPAVTVTVNGGSKDNVDFDSAIGEVLQLHDHSFPLFDTAVSSEIYVINDFTTANTKITDLNEIDALDDGTAITNNDRYNVVIWGVVSEETGDCKLFANLPSGIDTGNAAAIRDNNNYSNYSIPVDYRGTGFLIARVTLRYRTNNNGTYNLVNLEDLRGLYPSTSAGSGSPEQPRKWNRTFYPYNMTGSGTSTYNGVAMDGSAGGAALNNRHLLKSYDGSDAEGCLMNTQLPTDYVAGTDLRLTLITTTSTTGSNYIITVGVTQPNGSDEFDGDGSTEYISATIATSNGWVVNKEVYIFDGTGMEPGDPLAIVIYRDGSAGGDTEAGDVWTGTLLIEEV